MARIIGDRYTTAGDLAEEIRQFLGSAPRRSEPRPSPPARRCPACGDAISAGVAECTRCEQSGSASAKVAAGEAPSLERSIHETEHRQVTVLLCGCELEDVEASLSALESDDQHKMMVFFRRCCRESVVRLGGTVAVATPQGLQACFGFPIAHEDAPRRAVDAALAVAEGAEALNERLRNT